MDPYTTSRTYVHTGAWWIKHVIASHYMSAIMETYISASDFITPFKFLNWNTNSRIMHCSWVYMLYLPTLRAWLGMSNNPSFTFNYHSISSFINYTVLSNECGCSSNSCRQVSIPTPIVPTASFHFFHSSQLHGSCASWRHVLQCNL